MKLVTFVDAGGRSGSAFCTASAVVDPLLASGDDADVRRARSPSSGPATRAVAGRQSASLANRTEAGAHPAQRASTLAAPLRALDHPVQRQQLQRPQRREGEHADQRQGAGVLRQDRRLRGRSRRADRVRCADVEEARLRGRAGDRHRQARAPYPGRARARSCLRLHHRQRRDRARPPGAANARGHDLVRTGQRQGVRFERAARPVHRDRRRDRRSAEASGAIARQRRAAAVEQHGEHDLDLRRS